ncbi:MAG: putative acyltransferase, partial [Ilumatobacteraceae bacterium]|nr:putative acyltransferase [Ilumatobacteraceae bacterium]
MPGLDGLRALAVVAVMVYHADHAWLSGGFLGVEVFFVISGYLITLLLIAEHERTDKVNLVQFWKRRFRRLLPALFVMMGVLGVYLAVWYRRPQGRTRGDFLGGIFYGSNWYQIVVGQSYTASEAFAPLRHLWSLAVEEQFYLVWPIIMVVILRRGRDRLPKVALWLTGISAAIAIAVGVLFVSGDVADECGGGGNGYATLFGRCFNINDALYLGTFTRAGGLLLGAAFAMVWRPLALLRGPMRSKGRLLDVFALLGVAALALLTFKLSLSGSGSSFGSRYDPWLFRGGFFVTGLATLAIIAAVVHRRSFAGRILGNPLLAWIGTRSYGLYLYHWPIYQIIRKFAGVPLTWKQFVLAMAITVPVTELSYRLVETPIRTGKLRAWLRNEDRVRRANHEGHRRKVVALIATVSMLMGFAGVSIAVAKNVCVGDVECSVEAGAAAESAGPAAIGPVAVPTSAPRGSTTTTDSSDSSDATGVTTSTSSAPTDATATTTLIATDPTATTVAGAVDPLATNHGVPSTLPQTTVPVPVSVDPAVTTPSASTATVPPSTAPAATTIQPIALGESVMLGAITNLQAGGFYVDAV